jgi:hypothetical protein
VADVLLYQTSDPEFANRAIEALSGDGIQCYRLGSGFVDIVPAIRQDLGAGISIYLRHEEDRGKANAILIRLGGVIDEPALLPTWVAWVLYAVLGGVAIAAASLFWKSH